MHFLLIEPNFKSQFVLFLQGSTLNVHPFLSSMVIYTQPMKFQVTVVTVVTVSCTDCFNRIRGTSCFTYWSIVPTEIFISNNKAVKGNKFIDWPTPVLKL